MKKNSLILILLVLLQAIGCSKAAEPNIIEEPGLSQEEAPKITTEAEKEPIKDEGEKETKVTDEKEEEEVAGFTDSKVLIFDGFPIERISLIKPEIIHSVDISINKLEPNDSQSNYYRLIYLSEAKEDEVIQYLEELIDLEEDSYMGYSGTIDGLYASGSYVNIYDDFAQREYMYVYINLGLEPEKMGGDNPYFEFPISELVKLPTDSVSLSQIYQNSINIYEEDLYYTNHIEGFNSSLTAEEILKFYQDFTLDKDNLDYYKFEGEHVFRWTQGKYNCDVRIRDKKMNLASDFTITVQEIKSFKD